MDNALELRMDSDLLEGLNCFVITSQEFEFTTTFFHVTFSVEPNELRKF